MRRRRSYSSLQRRKPTREPRACILIVCEGKKTEPAYFLAMRKRLGLTSVEVEVIGGNGGSAPITIVDSAVALKLAREILAKNSVIHREYDYVWCVIDVEAPHPHESLYRACNKATDNGLRMALSNPCFEYWYLLHFEKTCKLFVSNYDVIHDLKQHFAKYSKINADIFEDIYLKTDQAIKWAKEILRETGCNDDPRNHNSSTTVHKLVEILKQIAENG